VERAAARGAARFTEEAEIAPLEARPDEELIRAALAGAERERCLDALFRRHQRRVASWCLRWCGGRVEDAADLAQEVFLRAQEKLPGFRFESAFTTWLYLVTRTVALNRIDAERRRPAESLEDHAIDPVDPAPSSEETAVRSQQAALLRSAAAAVLDPLEARVLHLHFSVGMTLAAIDGLLGLENRSGSKAFVVSAKRKLKRYFEAGGPGGVAAGEEA
jgi:RNA polymerase sigma factor (sigma-70 family)